MLMNGFFYVNILIHSSIDKIFDFVYFTVNFISLLSRKRYMQILCFQFTSLYKDYVKTCIMILACCYLYRFIHFCTAQWNFFSLKWWNFVISYFFFFFCIESDFVTVLRFTFIGDVTYSVYLLQRKQNWNIRIRKW